jgi:hypothetical protein
MKISFALFVALLLSCFSAHFAFAVSYPASCPAEAQSIVSAVGGCSSIDPAQYSAIYGKCCTASAHITPAPLPAPHKKSVVSPTIPTPVPIIESSHKNFPWFPLLIWAGLIIFLYRKLWKPTRDKMKSDGTLKGQAYIVRQLGFWKFVSIAGILIFGNFFALALSILIAFSGELSGTIFAFIYTASLIGGLFFGLILWCTFLFVSRK